jgi:hypothetical protein
MNKIGKVVLWAAVVFVLVAVGMLVLAFAKSLTVNTQTYTVSDGGIIGGYAWWRGPGY